MLRYAAALNAQITEDTPAEEIERKTRFFVESEIAPALHDLKRDLNNPNRPWAKAGMAVASGLVVGFLKGEGLAKTAAEAIKKAMLPELAAKGDKHDAAKRNGLYYLLKAQAIRP